MLQNDCAGSDVQRLRRDRQRQRLPKCDPAAEAARQPELEFVFGTRLAPFRVINIVNAGEVFVERLNQIDLRFSKIFRFTGTRTNINFDFYNVTNSNSVIGENAAYGPAWRNPTNILLPRLFKISAQFDW